MAFLSVSRGWCARRSGRGGEFAILVRSDAKETGLGGEPMARLFKWARAERFGAVVGQVLVENRPMRRDA